MRTAPVAAALTLGLLAMLAAGARYEPRSNPEAEVRCDDSTRFTILMPRVVRLEYRPNTTAPFVDDASIAFIHRQTTPPPFKVANATDWCNVTVAGGLEIQYRKTATNPKPRGAPACPAGSDVQPGHQPDCRGRCQRVPDHPDGVPSDNATACCALCAEEAQCGAWVFGSDVRQCWLLTGANVAGVAAAANRTLGRPAPFFVRHALTVVGPGGAWVWHAGDDGRAGNLNGTLFPTPSTDLAGCCSNPDTEGNEYDPKYPLDVGLLSRDGFALVEDDTDLVRGGVGLWDAGWPVAGARAASALDWYLFGCGAAYEACLGDYTALAGPIALPPLHALGVWWSRHWGDPFDGNPFGPMSAGALTRDVLQPYRDRGLPLHTVVLDMEWHSMVSTSDCATMIGKKGWGGYTWNATLFPDVPGFVAALHGFQAPNGTKLALNYHPDEGIDRCQAQYPAMARALGADPASGALLPDLNPSALNRTYANAYFAHMIEPTLVDFPWTDSPKVTTWSNYLYVAYPALRANRRVVNFSRYGGKGAHRTPTGFSGDTLRRFDTLAYEVWMTPQAANVGFGWWSHDIGGFSGGYLPNSTHTEGPELFLRWLQFAAFAPVFRTHCRYCDQRIWTFGEAYYTLMRSSFLLRNALVPYIYSFAALRTHAAGVSLVRPMYWAPGAAALPAAYAGPARRQYLFGDDFVVAPITAPVDPANQSTSKTVWVPPGAWLEARSFAPVPGGQPRTATYGLADIPLYVRSGAVVPTRDMRSAYLPYARPVMWLVALAQPTARAAPSGSAALYEDDGETMDFLRGNVASALTTFNYTLIALGRRGASTSDTEPDAGPDSDNTTYRLSAAVAAVRTTAASPARRPHEVLLPLVPASAVHSATCNGQALQPVPRAGGEPGYWSDSFDWLPGTFLVLRCNAAAAATTTIVLEFGA